MGFRICPLSGRSRFDPRRGPDGTSGEFTVPVPIQYPCGRSVLPTARRKPDK